MRQAKPDDVFQFTTLEQIIDLWPDLECHPGSARPLWTWLLRAWEDG